MNFNDKYNGNKNAAMRDGLLISDKIGICQCGKPTQYIDIYSESYFCSEECYHRFYDEMNEWANKNDEIY